MAVVYPSSHARSERTIALARVTLASAVLFSLSLAPPPAVHGDLIRWLYWSYVVYATLLFGWLRWWDGGDLLPIVIHVIDLAAFTVFQYLTQGPSSPFFVYFLFAVFCGALRWGWQGSLYTGGLVAGMYIAMAFIVGNRPTPANFESEQFLIRLVILVIATGILVYLGRYEARLRLEIERLARWPAPPLATEPDTAIGRILEYGAKLMQANNVLVLWQQTDEPSQHEARWQAGSVTLERHARETFPLTTEEAVAKSTFICAGPVQSARAVMLSHPGGRLVRYRSVPLHPEVLARIEGDGLATAPLQTDALTGRVFFSGLGVPPAEVLPLTDLVAREIAYTLDQMHSSRRRDEMAAREERIRVARDLHDGVLQGLTGVRLELRALSKALNSTPATAVQESLGSVERALAMEQRELRFFIAGVESRVASASDVQDGLARRLDSIRERLSLEWKTPVSIRISPGVPEVSQPLQEAVPMMVHEATVNALKHAQPSRVSVDVDSADGHLRIAVTDDGHGFPFKGNYSHETLASTRVAPRSLLDRVTALGGRLSINSSDRGSRVEMVLSL